MWVLFPCKQFCDRIWCSAHWKLCIVINEKLEIAYFWLNNCFVIGKYWRNSSWFGAEHINIVPNASSQCIYAQILKSNTLRCTLIFINQLLRTYTHNQKCVDKSTMYHIVKWPYKVLCGNQSSKICLPEKFPQLQSHMHHCDQIIKNATHTDVAFINDTMHFIGAVKQLHHANVTQH